MAELTLEQRAAYQECVNMAARNGWWGVHTAMTEDGPAGGVDWVKMLSSWQAEEDSNRLFDYKANLDRAYDALKPILEALGIADERIPQEKESNPK